MGPWSPGPELHNAFTPALIKGWGVVNLHACQGAVEPSPVESPPTGVCVV
jgi:hypothetical protein